jgi:hypothetical protein
LPKIIAEPAVDSYFDRVAAISADLGPGGGTTIFGGRVPKESGTGKLIVFATMREPANNGTA